MQSAGALIDVVITSGTQAQMDEALNSIQLGNLDGAYTVHSAPQNQIVALDTAFNPTATTLSGFIVDGIRYNDNIRRWVIDARYETSANTITSLYVSKVGAKPYSTDVLNSFYISQHPCMSSVSICCMNDYRAHYITGLFGDTIDSVVGTCPASLQNRQTLGLFNVTHNQDYVDNVFQNFQNSSVHRVTNEEIQIQLFGDELKQNFSTVERLPTGAYKYTFFVGMTFFTMLPANALSTVSAQTQITVQISNSLAFSFASNQDYTFIDYITLGVVQNRWVDGLIDRQMQHVKVGVVLPLGVQQVRVRCAPPFVIPG